MSLSPALLLLLTTLARAAEPAAAPVPEPTSEQQALYQRLSIRDPAPTCAEVSTLSSQPATDLLFLVEHASQPPWVSMRAAECLLDDHAPEIQPTLRRWVVDPQTRGLALLTLNRLDRLPRPQALELARLARRGAHAEAATVRIRRATVTEIRAIADTPVENLPPLPEDLRPLVR